MKDYYSDYGHNFVKIFKNSELPEFVKEAEMIPEETLSKLPDEAFADKVARKLPISSAADTYISTAYHLFCNDKDENVASSLSKAASYWGIEDEVAKLQDLLSDLSKTAGEAEANAGWSLSHTVGAESGFELSGEGEDTESLKTAWVTFSKQAGRFPFADRVDIAKKFSVEFTKMGMEVPFELGAMSEENLPNSEVVAQEIKSRAIRIDDNSKKAELIELADILFSSEEKDLEGYHKLAGMLDEIDQQNRLTRFYGKSIRNPHEAVFNTPRGEAITACSTLKLAGAEYSLQELAEIHNDIYKLALTKDDYDMVTGKVANSIDHSKLGNISEESKNNLAAYL
jgi:hypothetical protein